MKRKGKRKRKRQKRKNKEKEIKPGEFELRDILHMQGSNVV